MRSLDLVPVQDQGTVLIGHDHVQDAPVEQVGQGDAPAVIPVVHADGFRHVVEARGAVVQVEPRPLEARKALIAHGRPVPHVLEDIVVAHGNPRHLVPVVRLRVGGDEAVGHEKVHETIVVQVAELGAPGPPRVGDFSFGNIDHPAVFRDQVAPEIVPLEKVASL